MKAIRLSWRSLVMLAGRGCWRPRGGAAGRRSRRLHSNCRRTRPAITALKHERACRGRQAARVHRSRWSTRSSATASWASRSSRRSGYLVDVLKENGFAVEEGVAGIPTAFVATWGSGRPVIALGSDIDGIPQSSQKPGVAYHDAARRGVRPATVRATTRARRSTSPPRLVLKRSWSARTSPGTIRIWPGVAEELVGTKAYFVRDGVFKDVDVVLFTHVGTNLDVSWGDAGGNGLVSVQYTFKGESAHAAGAPWRGRSALDAVELMDIGWNFQRRAPAALAALALRHRRRRRPAERRAAEASVWFYFRQITYQGIKDLWAIGDRMAQGAAMMTGTTLAAAPDARRGLAPALQPGGRRDHRTPTSSGRAARVERGRPAVRARRAEGDGCARAGLSTSSRRLGGPVSPAQNTGGGSDDIGDVSWNVPTVDAAVSRRTSRGCPATTGRTASRWRRPIAHKGVDRRREGAGDDAARPAPEARGRRRGVGLLQRRPDGGADSTSRSSDRRTSRPSS